MMINVQIRNLHWNVSIILVWNTTVDWVRVELGLGLEIGLGIVGQRGES